MEFEKVEIEKTVECKDIEPAQTECAAPIDFATKKDATQRFSVDYRRLSALMNRDSFHIPRMDKCIASLGDATVSSALCATSGYWQAEIDVKDRVISAFSSHHGL